MFNVLLIPKALRTCLDTKFYW